MEGEKKIRIRKSVLYLWIMVILVVLEVIFWTVARVGIWINDVWTFMTLGVLAIGVLFIYQKGQEKAEREAMEMFDEHKNKKDQIEKEEKEKTKQE
jgi:K+ transporter